MSTDFNIRKFYRIIYKNIIIKQKNPIFREYIQNLNISNLKGKDAKQLAENYIIYFNATRLNAVKI